MTAVESHVTLIGLLTRLWGALSVLVGVSMLLLAGGALLELRDPAASSVAVAAGVAAITFLLLAFLALAWGGAHLWAAALLDRRRPRGRAAVVVLGVCNLVVLPFGTALGAYAIWVLTSPAAGRLFEHHVWALPTTDNQKPL
jgi:hypothetical protein